MTYVINLKLAPKKRCPLQFINSNITKAFFFTGAALNYIPPDQALFNLSTRFYAFTLKIKILEIKNQGLIYTLIQHLNGSIKF